MTNGQPPLPNVSVQHLEYLRAVVNAPTWAMAAAEVGVTPSALSQGIRELERRLGLELFERSGRRQVLRPQAAEVVDYADRVLAQTRDLARWVAEANGGRAGRVRLGMIDAAAVHHFPGALRSFRDQRPELELHLVVSPSAPLLVALGRGELDLVVCVGRDEPVPGLVVEHLLDEPLHVYGPGPDCSPDPASWGPWVTFPPGSHTREVVARAVRAAGARFEVVAESHQPEVLREMVRLGMGWTVLPPPGAGDARRPGPEPVRSAPLLWRHLVAARRADALPNAAASELLEGLRAAVAGGQTPAR